MTNKQFSERIENIDDRLVQRAQNVQNNEKMHRAGGMRRLIALVAAAVLMVSSFAVGALAFSRETIVEIEVPVEQETLELTDIGISLILPDSWKGRYAMESTDHGEYRVYSIPIREAFISEYGGGTGGGMLFYILKWSQQITEEQWRDTDGEWNFAGNRYIMSTKDGTYLLYYASDVQYTVDTLDEYRQMEREIAEIRFVVDAAFSD